VVNSRFQSESFFVPLIPEFDAFCTLLQRSDEPIEAWFEASKNFAVEDLQRMIMALEWGQIVSKEGYADPEQLVSFLLDAGLVRYYESSTVQHIRQGLRDSKDPSELIGELFWREFELGQLERSGSDAIANALLSSASMCAALMSTLIATELNPLGRSLTKTWPEFGALRHHQSDHVTTEHEEIQTGAHALPLLEHLVDRSLVRKLRGLELGEIHIFQRDDALSEQAFDAEVQLVKCLEILQLMPVVRASLLFLDFAKGGTTQQRREWGQSGVDLTIHNEAAAAIISQNDVFDRFPFFRTSPHYKSLATLLVQHHGLVGQAVRGEAPLTVFVDLVWFIISERDDLAVQLSLPDGNAAADRVVDLLHLINVCDTAGVREGLFDDALRFEFLAVESLLRRLSKSQFGSRQAVLNELLACEGEAEEPNSPANLHTMRRWLFDRICRLRAGRIRAGEPPEETLSLVHSLEDEDVLTISSLLRRASLWYMEVATSVLTPSGQLKLLSGALSEGARQSETKDGFHVTFLPLVRDLDRHQEPASPYRIRLIETLLSSTSLSTLLAKGFESENHALGSIRATIGGSAAVAVAFQASAEATALLTLLPLYERKSNVAFHATLKGLCDLYGLRKDEFDRISNEAAYLVHMNSARSDKERMLDYVPDGATRVLEVGPGGGVVLDLISQRFPESEVVGIDLSRMVVESLQKRKEREKRSWSIIEGDAFLLSEHFKPDSLDAVVLCSLLHEIYSYVEYDIGENKKVKFRLESVRDLCRSCFDVLKLGGRIIIRDGVMPPDEPRIIRFKDPEGPAFFRLFQEEFEGRRILGEWVDEMTVKTNAPDAMEFLYCYTWGPESFPYEVREQYGVLPYDEYLATILTWLGPRARAVEVADPSYLQPGYIEGLESKVTLLNSDGKPTPLPDSNCLMIIERIE